MKIEALHEFHDDNFSMEWANRFEPTKDRMDLFNTIKEQFKNEASTQVLELGIGPGFLANYLLSSLDQIQYEGLDFAQAMLDIASHRNKAFADRIQLTQADLTAKDWFTQLQSPPNMVVSTWALHDLMAKENIAKVYQEVFEFLPTGGVLLNGDFIKPEASTFEYEAGRIKPSEHLQLLKQAGFSKVQCLKEFEVNVEKPTTANNYSCFMAVK